MHQISMLFRTFSPQLEDIDAFQYSSDSFPGFSLEHPQGVGIVGIVGTVGIVGMVGMVGIEFWRPEPRPTTPSVLVDI